MNNPNVSIIIPIVERYDDLWQLCVEFTEPFRKRDLSFELIFVVDGKYIIPFAELKELKQKCHEIRIIKFKENYGEGVALMAGFQYARGDIIFTLSAYFQVVPAIIPAMLDKLNEGYDLVITRRYPRVDNLVNRVQAIEFHTVLKNVTQFTFNDISCGLRAMRPAVARSLNLGANMHRFIPILAHQQGHKVIELKATQRIEDTKLRFHGPVKYIARLFDIMCLFFIINCGPKRARAAIIGGGLGALAGIALTMPVLQGYQGSGIFTAGILLGIGIFLFVVGIEFVVLGLVGRMVSTIHTRDDDKECQVEVIVE